MDKWNKFKAKCRFCNKEFIVKRSNKFYCSKECFKESMKLRKKEYGHKKKDENYIRRTTCKYCGERFPLRKIKGRCCKKEECIEQNREEKRKESQKRYYNNNVKKTTNKFKMKNALIANQYRKLNKDDVNLRDRLRKEEKRKWIEDLKKNSKCLKCGEDKWFCLEFHHKDKSQKKFGISEAISSSYGKKAISEEIDKCVLLCRNCHAHLHHLEKINIGWQADEEWFLNKNGIEQEIL